MDNRQNLNPALLEGLKKQNIDKLNDIQNMVMPYVLENKDVIVKSHTGSGKTLAYLLPLFQKIDTSKRENQVIVLAPTHELVMQIESQIKLLAQNSEIAVTSQPIIGEVNIQKQIKKLKDSKPHIIVGSCGRILDLIKQKKIKAHTVKTIVLDEGDNLLSGKNTQVVKDIIKTTLRDRQLLLFSASLSKNSIEISNELMKEPVLVETTKEHDLNPNINHMYLLGDKRDKFKLLRKSLAAVNPKKAIVFVNDEESIEAVCAKLNFHNRPAMSISGTMTKENRKKAMESFRRGKVNILVSSDLSSRGLDITDISHVFNLDFPINTDDYIHRCGRTARGKNKGCAISIVTHKELGNVRVYEKEFKIKINRKDLSEGKMIPFVPIKK